MLKITLLILTLALASFLVTPCAAVNMLSNSGFETLPSLYNWTTWYATWSGGYSAGIDAAAAYAGTYGLKEVITGSASFGVYQQVATTAGNAYKLNGMWRAVTAGTGNWFEIILIDGAYDINKADSGSGMTVYNNVVAGWDSGALFNHPAPASWAWQPFSQTYGNCVSPYISNGVRTASGSTMTVILKIGCNTATHPTVYFDEVTLTPVPKATVTGPSSVLTRTGPVSYTVSFTEPVTGFDSASDIQINATGSAAVGNVAVTGSGSGPYTVTLSNISGEGNLGVTVKAGAAQNADGNDNLASSASSVFKALAADGSILSTKGLPEGAAVELANKVMYLKTSSLAYIEEPDRTSGIKLTGNLAGSAGDKVLLLGTFHKNAVPEPCITVSIMVSNGTATLVPFGATNRALASTLLDGLYVAAWGKVKSVVGNSYVISDGSDSTGITVNTQSAPTVSTGDFATLTGAAGISGGARVIYAR